MIIHPEIYCFKTNRIIRVAVASNYLCLRDIERVIFQHRARCVCGIMNDPFLALKIN